MILSNQMYFRLFRLRSYVLALVLSLGGTTFLFAAAVLGGWVSTWYMVENGSRLTTRRVGPWVTWVAAARPEADPYTRAHFARTGSLSLSAGIARIWTARVDDTRQRLHSACDYVIEGSVEGPWWSVAVFDERGRLISNASERHSYTSETIALGPDGRFSISLGRDARSGNWLPTGGAGRLIVNLTVLDQRSLLAAEDGSGEVLKTLPAIRRLACR